MDEGDVIKRLKHIEAWADEMVIGVTGLKKEATELRKIMEGVSTPSLHKGLNDVEKKIVLEKRMKRRVKKTASGN
jgi:hypothetical protein